MSVRYLFGTFVSALLLSLCVATAGAQELVIDLATGGSSGPEDFVSLDGNLYFTANDGVHGVEPWKYNSETGATMLADLYEGESHSAPTQFTRVGEYVYFGANAGGNIGRELWRYDGASPPELVANLGPGGDCSCANNLTEFQGSLIFSSAVAEPSRLWTVSGDGAPIQPFPNDPSGASPDDFVVLNDVLYYTAEDDQLYRGIWRFDGSSAPQLVLPGEDWTDMQSMTALGESIVFTAENHMWSWDGTSDPVELTSSEFGNEFPNGPHSYTQFNERLYFSGFDPDHQYELWVWDGSGEPELAADVVEDEETDPQNFVEFNGELFFQGLGFVWRYDGENAPTKVEQLEVAYRSQMAVHDGRIYFNGGDEEHGYELWSWDGVNPPELVVDINRSESSGPEYLLAHEGAIYFFVESDPVHLIQYDGSEIQLIDILDDSEHTTASVGLTVWDGALYFLARNSGASDWQLAPRDIFRYDGGTVASFQARINFNESGGGTFPDELVAGDDRLYFTGHDGTNGYELWSWDGENDPGMVADIVPGSGSSDPQLMTWFDGALYFKAETPIDGEALWRYTPGEGAELFHPTNIQTPPFEYRGNLYFSHGKLWVYDGAGPPGIVEIADGGFPNPTSFATLNDQLYFSTHRLSGRSYLYAYDGVSPPDTVDLGAATSNVSDLAVIGDALCFRGEEGSEGRQLWCHRPGTGETERFELNSSRSSDPMSFAVLGDHLYFAADDGISGRELWRISESRATDAARMPETPSAAVLEFDVYPNPAGATASLAFDSIIPGQHVEIDVFDLLGRQARPTRKVRSVEASGGIIRLDMSDLSVGVYFVRMRGDGVDVTKPIVRSR